MKCIGLILFLFLISCASSDQKLVDEGGIVPTPALACGTDSFLNQYALYQCQSLELEDNNDHVGQPTPIHNISPVTAKTKQPLLVIGEKVFHAQLRESDQQVVCERRLEVVLNPGVGATKNYQKGWLTYRPTCFQFKGQSSGVLYGHRP